MALNPWVQAILVVLALAVVVIAILDARATAGVVAIERGTVAAVTDAFTGLTVTFSKPTPPPVNPGGPLK